MESARRCTWFGILGVRQGSHGAGGRFAARHAPRDVRCYKQCAEEVCRDDVPQGRCDDDHEADYFPLRGTRNVLLRRRRSPTSWGKPKTMCRAVVVLVADWEGVDDAGGGREAIRDPSRCSATHHVRRQSVS